MLSRAKAAVGASGVGVLGLVAAVTFIASGSTTTQAGVKTSSTDSAEAQQVHAWAAQVAKDHGGGSYSSIEWVTTTRGASSEKLFHTSAGDTEFQPEGWNDTAYAIQIKGDFTMEAAQGRTFKGSIILANLDGKTGSAEDFTMLTEPADLSTLGTVNN